MGPSCCHTGFLRTVSVGTFRQRKLRLHQPHARVAKRRENSGLRHFLRLRRKRGNVSEGHGDGGGRSCARKHVLHETIRSRGYGRLPLLLCRGCGYQKCQQNSKVSGGCDVQHVCRKWAKYSMAECLIRRQDATAQAFSVPVVQSSAGTGLPRRRQDPFRFPAEYHVTTGLAPYAE